jgi:hypothetical protein
LRSSVDGNADNIHDIQLQPHLPDGGGNGSIGRGVGSTGDGALIQGAAPGLCWGAPVQDGLQIVPPLLKWRWCNGKVGDGGEDGGGVEQGLIVAG